MSTTLRSNVVTVLALIGLLAVAQAASTSKPQADAFAKKVAIINQHAERSPNAARRTTVTESELNSWFVYRAPALLPQGLTEPKITIVGNGKLLGGATIDLEAIGKKKSAAGGTDLWSLLGGRVPLSVSGVLRTNNGRGTFELQAADISGVPVPKSLLQELLAHFTKSAERPNGVRLEDQFTLPANIKQIEVGQGQAVVVQ